MSAIFGIFRMDGQNIDPELIKNMGNVLSHRGPDGSGVCLDGSVALGHQMLHTTPESVMEKLPFKDETTGMVITADARIDNRGELSTLLNLGDTEKVPDSLFILKAYQKWGENCPDRLLGDFAFAIWDPINECLFCARDHMGVKSFYYYLSDDVFYFATEMKAILTLPDVPRKLNELKVAFHLMIEFVPEFTFYANIYTLTPAHSLKINCKGHEIKKYWELDHDLKIEMDSDEDYVNEFLEIFEEAIKCRMRCAFPIGFELSGGLDSSSIVGMVKKIIKSQDSNSEHINTFTFFHKFFKDSFHHNLKLFNDEKEINPNLLSVDDVSPLNNMEKILYYEDQPFFTPHLGNTWNFYKMINNKGIRVIFNGGGGDHLGYFSKYFFRDLFVTLKWKKLFRELSYYASRVNQNFFNLFLKKVIIPSIPLHIKLLGRKVLKSKSRCYILNKNLVEKLGGEKYLEKLTVGTREYIHTSRKDHYRALTAESLPLIFDVKDHALGAYNIEPRYPFRDKRLVEFYYSVPNDIKFRFGFDRYLHRLSMEGIVPNEIRWNLKKDINSNYQRNLLLYEKEYIEKVIYQKNSIENYVDSEIMQEIYQEFSSGIFNRESIYIWLAVILNFWLESNDNF